KYNRHRYLTDFRVAYEDILSRGCLPVICGGSGMYVENALNGIRMPEVPVNEELREERKNYSLEELTHILSKYKTLHNTTDVDNVKRAIRAIEIGEYYRQHPEEASHISKDNAQPLNSLVVGLDIPREERRRSISLRLKTRLDNGMLQEVKNLLERGIHPEDLIYYGLEYKYLTLHLIGELSFEDMFQQLEIAIHQFAKRQMTWFRGMEKRGIKIHWLPYDLPEDDFIEKVQELIFSQD
ncbi:MAG: tRNA (adenosine(37)-N6)-dimethylallyltransferase MiaA, partial [Muribaculaceae bacterium]|nr:tRNA (adenosine(37)-N6)-dimethylallyltransferase MiaA [Muribaculaceae bacterium]